MKNFECFLNKPIAHRGLHNDQHDENTTSAFQRAIDAKYPIETDVHILIDGTVAVHHDSNLKRVCGADVIIENLNKEDLKKYKTIYSSEQIITLPELLDLVNGQVPILIELKTSIGYKSNKLEAAVLRDLKNYKHKDKIAIQSFDPFAIRWISKHTNEYPFGQLATMGESKNQGKLMFKFIGRLYCCKISKPQFIAYDVRHMPNKYLQKYIKKGTPILAWTVNSKQKLEHAQKNADNIIFEEIIPE